MFLTQPAAAQPNPWPFDFDSTIAADPLSINLKLVALGQGLDPLPAAGMANLPSGAVDLYYFGETAILLDRAGQVGVEPMSAHGAATLCAAHAAFVLPELLLPSPGAACVQANDAIAAALAELARDCLHIEFAEDYVREFPPAQPDATIVSSLEGLIGLAGEALTHVDVPRGLLPPDFLAAARRVIAKIRHEPLDAAAAARLLDYGAARDLLTANSACFDSVAQATLLTDLTALEQELDAARSYLADLVAAGEAQALLDRQRVLDSGRDRPELPYPSLTDDDRLLLSFYIGGLYWRMRGHGLVELPDGATLKRILYTLEPTKQLCLLNGGPGFDAVAEAIYAALHLGWGDYFDMGRNPVGDDKYEDLVNMTGRGRYQVESAVAAVAGAGFETHWLMAGGLQMGPCYYYGWEELSTLNIGADLTTPYVNFIEGPTAVGEFCTGASISLGLAKMFLRGTCVGGGCHCLPACGGRQCGDDGCGGTCGTCDARSSCGSDGDCTCVPACGSNECGADGCGGSCGTCAPNEECDAGTCVCSPDCAGVQCGDDGCSGSCGSCSTNESCTGGVCVCVPNCPDGPCGDDGCGGSCGDDCGPPPDEPAADTPADGCGGCAASVNGSAWLLVGALAVAGRRRRYNKRGPRFRWVRNLSTRVIRTFPAAIWRQQPWSAASPPRSPRH